MAEMNEFYEADSIEGLAFVDSFVHDCEFSLDDLVYDENARTVSVPFKKTLFNQQTVLKSGLLKKLKAPTFEFNLKVFDVRELFVEDPQQIGIYEFSGFEFSSDDRSLIVETDAFLVLRMHVDMLKVSILKSPEPISFEIYRSI